MACLLANQLELVETPGKWIKGAVPAVNILSTCPILLFNCCAISLADSSTLNLKVQCCITLTQRENDKPCPRVLRTQNHTQNKVRTPGVRMTRVFELHPREEIPTKSMNWGSVCAIPTFLLTQGTLRRRPRSIAPYATDPLPPRKAPAPLHASAGTLPGALVYLQTGHG